MVREMIKRWWAQLKAATSEGNDPRYQRCSRYVVANREMIHFSSLQGYSSRLFVCFDRSVNGLYMAMVSISATIARLKNRKGRVAEKALVSILVSIMLFS